MKSILKTTFTLPSGLVVKNRLVKVSTTECLGNEYNQATVQFANVWKAWAQRSDVGLILTGNILIDRRFPERAGNIVLDPAYPDLVEQGMPALKAAVKSGQTNGARIFAQISHAGRQANPDVCKLAVAPSAVQMVTDMPHAQCEEMSKEMILEAIDKFVFACKIAEEAGFDGVQLHAAHGYLISQFLNPLVNLRTDEFGGSVERRAEFLMRLIREVKANTGKINPKFAVGVKLNSSDFQKGGFSVNDCLVVADMLSQEKIDFLELSGGNYEQPVLFTGVDDEQKDIRAQSTVRREAYFLDFADQIAKAFAAKSVYVPLIVTGGFRSRKAMEEAIESKASDLIGLARPLCMDFDSSKKLLNGEIDSLPRIEAKWRLPWFLGMDFMQKYKAIQGATMGGVQMMLSQNILDVANEKDNQLTEEKHPNLLFILFYRLWQDKKNSDKLRGLKWDRHLQPKYKESK